MNVLIICSYYPPDSAISAIRPYMFAKYLSQMGDHVTVLRSGEFNSTPDGTYEALDHVRVLSYLGEQSDAELYAIGAYTVPESKGGVSRSSSRARRLARLAFHLLKEPLATTQRLKRAKQKFILQKHAIDSLEDTFDLVISTYSEIENVFAGEYAAQHFHAKWIMDFRDSIVDHIHAERYIWNFFARKYQRAAIQKADLCTAVSNGLAEELRSCSKGARVETLYNGFDGDESLAQPQPGKLSICYTGQIYGLRLSALKHLVASIQQLVDDGRVSRDAIAFHYAGPNSSSVQNLFSEYSLSDLLNDYGQVPRAKSLEVQNQADVFLVLSWNTKKAKGILTGKFYEGIRAKKPIVAVVDGDWPDSELKTIYQQYGYGFCYETCDPNMTTSDLSDYLYRLCVEKETLGSVSYQPSQDLENAFKYEHIVRRLNDLAHQLCEKE